MTKEPNEKKLKCLARPHNCYNIFFILERERLIQQAKEESSSHNGAYVASNLESGEGSESYDLVGYESLNLPDLPPRYHGLSMKTGWYVPGKNARRKHVKTHGLKSFAGLARTVANNWKTVDDVTNDYCQTVARIIRERHAVLSRTKGFYAPKKKAKNSAKNTTSGRRHLDSSMTLREFLAAKKEEALKANRKKKATFTGRVPIPIEIPQHYQHQPSAAEFMPGGMNILSHHPIIRPPSIMPLPQIPLPYYCSMMVKPENTEEDIFEEALGRYIYQRIRTKKRQQQQLAAHK